MIQRDAEPAVVHDLPWVLPAFIAVALVAVVLYTWNLAVSGFANTFYSAAALAGSQSWSAWFFGSVDASNFMTVDKPPLATMLVGLSVRLFGLQSLSILLPEALLGVGSVVIVMLMVQRAFGPTAAVIAGLIAAVSPVAVLIFRYNNPDALLTFLLVAGAWALQRSLVAARVRWLVLAAILVGLAFNAKFLQAYLVLPAFVGVWLIAAPTTLRARLVGLVPMALAGFVASAWWIAIVSLIPSADRPFIGGSTDGSPLNLLLDYDGLGRIAGAGGSFFSGQPGPLRLFNIEWGAQISWFIPLAFIALAVGLWLRRVAPRTDLGRAAYLLWGGWLLVHAIVFSFMSGTIHGYYTVVLVPPIAALVGAGMVDLWRLRSRAVWGGVILAGALGASAFWALNLLARTPSFVPGLGIAIFALSLPALVVLAMPMAWVRRGPSVVAVVAALVALGLGPMAYAADTMTTAYSGGTPAAGPVSGVATGGTGSALVAAFRNAFQGPGAGPGGGSARTGAGGGGGRSGGGGRGTGGFGAPGFQGPGDAGSPGGAGPAGGSGPVPGTGSGRGSSPGGAGFGSSGPITATSNISPALARWLVANRGPARWIVAISDANAAYSLELATGAPAMTIGGFTGRDPAPTLSALQAGVAAGDLRFVLITGGQALTGGGGNRAAVAIARWLPGQCKAVDTGQFDGGTGVGGTLYDCQAAN